MRPLDASRAELAALFEGGRPVEPGELAGFAFRGISLGLPGIVDRLLWKTFAKVFVADPSGAVHGFNLRIVQEGLEAPYRPRRRRPRFGEFLAVSEGERTLLDYGRKNPRWHPLATMRDRLVGLDDDTFLGRADIATLGREFVTPSYFVLERSRALDAGTRPDRAHLGLERV